MKREIENFAGLMLLSLLQVHLDGKRRLSDRIFAEALELFEENFYEDYLGGGSCIEQTIIDRETLDYVFDCVATLPESCQQVFRLRFLDELSFSEISELLGVTEVNARQKIRQLRLRLQSLPL